MPTLILIELDFVQGVDMKFASLMFFSSLIWCAACSSVFGQTVLQYGFDATSGSVTVPITDDSGAGNHGVALLHGGDAPTYSSDIPASTQFVTGIGSIDFSGTSTAISTAVSEGVGSGQGILTAAEVAAAGGFTMEVWVKNATGSSGSPAALGMFGGHKLIANGTRVGYLHGDNDNDQSWLIDYDTSDWVHLAVTLETTDPDAKVFTNITSYVNGTPIHSGSHTMGWWLDRATSVGNHQYADWNDYEGLVYEPRISLGILSPSEFTCLPMPTAASNPTPDNSHLNVASPVTLQWYAGALAETHRVYVGSDSTSLSLQEEVAVASYDLGDLAAGTTYYWRVDEVSDSGAVVVPGDVWFFTTAQGSTPPCAGYANDGDIDGDCVVGISDLTILAEQWMVAGACLTTLDCADIDGSEYVDFGDLAYISRDWLDRVDTLERRNVIVWIGAHPDDEYFAAAVGLAKYCAAEGHRGVYIQVTKGEGGRDNRPGENATGYAFGEVRGEEAKFVSSGLNCDIRFLNLWDGQVSGSSAALHERVTHLIRQIQPDVVMTHGPEGEYGHIDHRVISAQVTNAVIDAANPNMYPEQLVNGQTVWATPKFYRIVDWDNTDPITLHIDGVVYSDVLETTYYDYARVLLNTGYVSQAINDGHTRDHCSLSLISHSIAAYGGSLPDETSLLDGLDNNFIRPVCIRDWLICGSFTGQNGDLDFDYLAEDGGETAIIPTVGMLTDGKEWIQINNDRDLVDFHAIYDEDHDTVAYAYAEINSEMQRDSFLRIFSHGGMKVFLNGQLVHTNPMDRDYDYDDIVPISLNAGINHLLVKVKAEPQVADPDDGSISKPWCFFTRYD